MQIACQAFQPGIVGDAHALSLQPPVRYGQEQSGGPDDQQFVSMLERYRPSGGIATGTELCLRTITISTLTLGALARAIAQGEALHFEWRSQYWLPFFQFERNTMRLRPEVGGVLAELRNAAASAWDQVRWFVEPHPALSSRAPLDVVLIEPDRVRAAASCGHQASQPSS